MYEVAVGDSDQEIMEFIGMSPSKLPWYKTYPLYPTGKVENEAKATPSIIKSIKCDQVFSTTEKSESTDGWLIFHKEAVNKIIGFEKRKIGKTKITLMRMETRKQVTLKGKISGKGTETVTYYIVAETGEPFEEVRKFKYEYKTGFGLKRRTEYASGEYIKRLEKKTSYSKTAPHFPELSYKKNSVPYFTDKDGLFIPVILNEKMNTKMFVDPLLEDSFIDYEYYLKNYDGEPKDYLLPFDRLDVGKNVVSNPSILVKKVVPGTRTSYKIPGIIGSNLLSKGAIYIDDKKRTFSFFEPDEKRPKNAIAFEVSEQSPIPVFEVMVNNSPVKATISFGNFEPVISSKLKELLSLRVREIAISKTTCESCFIKKAELIITPPDRSYFKTEAVVSDMQDKPYDLILGLEYIKNKSLLINYKEKWFSID